MYYMNSESRKTIFFATESEILSAMEKSGSPPLIDVVGAEHLLRLLCYLC